MNPKPYSKDRQSDTVAAESTTAYTRTNDGVISTFPSESRSGRMTVDEYFDEVRRVLHKKYEEL